MTQPHALGHRTPFVGRIKELKDIATRLADPECRLLTLIGLGGSGKTRLAIEAAAAVADLFPQGTLFVALQPIPRGELMLPAIAQAVGLTFYGKAEEQEQLIAFLQDKMLLLILDSIEHLLDEAAFVSRLLAAAPGVTILATSREALRLQEEWLYPLAGLATPPSVYSSSLEEYEAAQLFLSHAQRIQPAFDLASEREAVIRICRMTAGLPLAIELAASWLAGLNATHIAQAMQRNLDMLSTTARNVDARHRSMRAVFDQSWALLSEDERQIFARLSVFRGGFTRDAAEQVAQATLANLAALVEKSLIQRETADRFGIHELLRQYGAEKLEALGETRQSQASHSQYFAECMRGHEAALKGPRQLEAMHRIEHDLENMRLAWEWSAHNQQSDHLHAMLDCLYLFGFLSSRYRETTAIFQQALEQPIDDMLLRGRLIARRWGYLHWGLQADYAEALQSIEQALAIAQAQEHQFEIAFCHLMAAYALMNLQRYAETLPRLEASQALFTSLNEPYYVCWVLHRLGYVFYNLNDPGKGSQYTEQSLALARVTQNRIALVICLYNLGSDHIFKGDPVRARMYCAEALQVASEVGHQGQIAFALSLLAFCAFFQEEYTTAQEYAERSWAIVENINMLVYQSHNIASLILLACLREEYAECARLRELAERHNTNIMGSQLLCWALAVWSCGVGHSSEARAYIAKVLQRSNLQQHAAITACLAPCMPYILATTEPAMAVELLAWVFTYPHISLSWARQWPLLRSLQFQLQAAIDPSLYHTHWERGKALSLESVASCLQQLLHAPANTEAGAAQHSLLTGREREILSLVAAGKTNPQIAAQLIIGVGTVKTHTLNIYRKLEVANRTQAIVRGQELGLLSA